MFLTNSRLSVTARRKTTAKQSLAGVSQRCGTGITAKFNVGNDRFLPLRTWRKKKKKKTEGRRKYFSTRWEKIAFKDGKKLRIRNERDPGRFLLAHLWVRLREDVSRRSVKIMLFWEIWRNTHCTMMNSAASSGINSGIKNRFLPGGAESLRRAETLSRLPRNCEWMYTPWVIIKVCFWADYGLKQRK